MNVLTCLYMYIIVRTQNVQLLTLTVKFILLKFQGHPASENVHMGAIECHGLLFVVKVMHLCPFYIYYNVSINI